MTFGGGARFTLRQVNVLSEEKKQQVLGLGWLGWSLRRIQRETHIRRETAAAYLKAAGIAVRPPGGWGRAAPKPAREVTTDFGAGSASEKVVPEEPRPGRSPSASAAESTRRRGPGSSPTTGHNSSRRTSRSSFGSRA
jgi:hypothetical protein